MSRPIRCRRVAWEPESSLFKPRGIAARELATIEITMDELETLRLADLEGLYQEDGASRMKISRQTFGNVLASAHNKVADALVNSKALKIKGGVVEMAERRFVCSGCKHEWGLPYGGGRPQECPGCKSADIHRAPADRGCARRGMGRGGRGRCRRSAQ